MTAAELAARRCIHATKALSDAEAAALLAALPGWTIENGRLMRSFSLRDHYETLAFVNALAWISHGEDHHPELTVGYKHCVVRYDTHSVNGGKGGLSENDFICAAKVSALFEQRRTA